jgi:hypothetical protein
MQPCRDQADGQDVEAEQPATLGPITGSGIVNTSTRGRRPRAGKGGLQRMVEKLSLIRHASCMSELFARPDSAARRSERAYHALTHLADRHAATPGRRSRQVHPAMPAPHEVVRLVAGIAGGSIIPEPGEQDVDENDLVAALTLVPSVRADLDSTELALLKIARSRGMTWQDIAFGLGLNTPQAAKQRYERLEARAEDAAGTDG